MPIRLSINATGIPEAIKTLKDLEKRVQPRSHQEFLREIVAPELSKEFTRIFDSGHPSWPPLAPSTIAEKARLGYPLRPNVRTGAFRNASRNLHGMQISGNTLKMISTIYYSRYTEPVRPVYKIVADRIRRRIKRLYNKYKERQR